MNDKPISPKSFHFRLGHEITPVIGIIESIVGMIERGDHANALKCLKSCHKKLEEIRVFIKNDHLENTSENDSKKGPKA